MKQTGFQEWETDQECDQLERTRCQGDAEARPLN